MKSNIILVVFLFTPGIGYAQSNAENHVALTKTLNYYLEGGTDNDFEILKKAFHPTATMKFIRDGYKEVNALEFFEKGMKPGPKQNRKTRIVYTNISGTAASAQLETEYPAFTLIDYMNLLLIDGKWKIVSKIFYRQEKMKE